MHLIELNQIASNQIQSFLSLHFFHQIKWADRLIDSQHLVAKITTDGTDFRVAQQPNAKSWFSFKFKGPALRYEVAISITTGYIVWISPGFRAGRFPDISIFRLSGLKNRLIAEGEKTVADLGYRGEPLCVNLPTDGNNEYQYEMAQARARHETCNRRFKNWACMKNCFRHSITLHQACFEAVAVLTQMLIKSGESLYGVEVENEE